jgi:hypothetical protein
VVRALAEDTLLRANHEMRAGDSRFARSALVAQHRITGFHEPRETHGS